MKLRCRVDVNNRTINGGSLFNATDAVSRKLISDHLSPISVPKGIAKLEHIRNGTALPSLVIPQERAQVSERGCPLGNLLSLRRCWPSAATLEPDTRCAP